MKCNGSMEPVVLSLTEFWESEPTRPEHEDERRRIEAAINLAIKGARAVSWEGLALRGVHHIDVGDVLELTLRDENGEVLADCREANPFADCLILTTCRGGIVEMQFKREGE